MLISARDHDMLDCPEGCEGGGKVGVRTESRLGVPKIKISETRCIWDKFSKLLCNEWTDRFAIQTQNVEVTPPLKVVRTHELYEGHNGSVALECDGILEDIFATVAMKSAGGSQEAEEGLSVCEGSDYQEDIVKEPCRSGPGSIHGTIRCRSG